MQGDTVAAMRSNLGEVEQWIINQKAIADAHGDILIAYEGGQSSLANADTVNSDPAMYGLYLDYLTMISQYMPLFMAYNLNQGPWHSGGAWGIVNVDFSQQSTKIRALRDWLAANGGSDTTPPAAPSGLSVF
jgi:hypothetical protein